MMKLVDNRGIVFLEQEKPLRTRRMNTTLHVRRLTQGMKKTVSPKLMSREEFLTKVIKTSDSANV